MGYGEDIDYKEDVHENTAYEYLHIDISQYKEEFIRSYANIHAFSEIYETADKYNIDDEEAIDFYKWIWGYSKHFEIADNILRYYSDDSNRRSTIDEEDNDFVLSVIDFYDGEDNEYCFDIDLSDNEAFLHADTVNKIYSLFEDLYAVIYSGFQRLDVHEYVKRILDVTEASYTEKSNIERDNIWERIEKARQTREEFEEARYDLVNDKGFRDEFEDAIKRSRISPYESLLFTYSFLKKENGCWCKPITNSAASIHVTKDMCERLKAYNKNMNLGKAGEEIRLLVGNNGDLEIDFDGDSAYANKERVFFKPAGAFIHFILDYMRAFDAEKPENLFYSTLRKKQISGVTSDRYWLFIYDMEFKGFFETRTYEYLLVDESDLSIRCLDDETKKMLLQQVKNGKIPLDVSFENFDEMRMSIEDAAEQRKEEFAVEAMGKNNVKIDSRIQALRDLSDIRVRSMEDELIGAKGKDEERLRKAIAREKSKVADKIAILEEKMKYVGTYSLDAVCLIDVF